MKLKTGNVIVLKARYQQLMLATVRMTQWLIRKRDSRDKKIRKISLEIQQ